MGKIEKKKAKIIERIKFLEDEMIMNLKQKTSNTKEISLSDYQNKIQTLKKQLETIK
jgi:parvulin-like peptidyl-prolyl isomerase